MVEHLRERIAVFEARIGAGLEPFRDAATRLVSIPGVSKVAAHVIVAEIGIDMSRFPSVRHLISWAGLCPRMDESAGKRRSTRVRKGAPWLKTVLVQCAWAATPPRTTCFVTASRTGISARTTSIGATKRPSPGASHVVSRI